MDLMRAKNVKFSELENEIKRQLQGYGEAAFKATEKGLDEAAEYLVKELSKNSPKKTKKYSKNWKVKKNYKTRRYVGNSTMVKGEKGEIPLANILEYSTVRGKPHIQKTVDEATNKIATIIVNNLKNT